MLPKTKKLEGTAPSVDLSNLSPEEARDFLMAAMQHDPRRGTVRISGERYVVMRPEILVNIQKQLEQTVGASTKGFLYLAGEKSAEERLHIIRTFVPNIDMTKNFDEDTKRINDVVAITGWGRYDVLAYDRRSGVIRVALKNSPIAEAYGPSSRPVCHLIAGWLAGVGRRLIGRDLLCEEIVCKAQGRARCEFELNPMPGHKR